MELFETRFCCSGLSTVFLHLPIYCALCVRLRRNPVSKISRPDIGGDRVKIEWTKQSDIALGG
jgi:hypothetical protein